MGVNMKKAAIDLGIITNDPEPMVVFYRDVLGLDDKGLLKIPGGRAQQMAAGASIIKIVHLKNPVENTAAPGGLSGATGMRYITLWIDNLAEAVAACEAADTTIAVPISEIAPGVAIAIVEDPDGNWVELVQQAS